MTKPVPGRPRSFPPAALKNGDVTFELVTRSGARGPAVKARPGIHCRVVGNLLLSQLLHHHLRRQLPPMPPQRQHTKSAWFPTCGHCHSPSRLTSTSHICPETSTTVTTGAGQRGETGFLQPPEGSGVNPPSAGLFTSVVLIQPTARPISRRPRSSGKEPAGFTASSTLPRADGTLGKQSITHLVCLAEK